MSTHQMNQVEELCDRILMVNKGRAVLYGGLAEVKSRFQANSVMLEYQGILEDIPGITVRHLHQGFSELTLDGNIAPQQLLEFLVGRGLKIKRFEIASPPLNEIFLRVVGESHE